MSAKIKLDVVDMFIPDGCNIILGQSHFIKTVEDLYEVLVTTSPYLEFGIAFNEASGPCLIRKDGNAEDLIEAAVENAKKISAGHVFVILLRKGYPINVLNKIKSCQEVCRIYAATANSLQVVVAETEQGRGVIGVVDGAPPKGVEGPGEIAERKKLLRDIIGYKR
ncbi:adenosine-specific kinase [Thermovirga sp.]|uniref:adenosine-specific kinase n=1 Tax=Thermovirga sp. TaxID=2699834 RepID=UPI0025D49066|nr:adenosine-specific kinase [Thermovirga sp.]